MILKKEIFKIWKICTYVCSRAIWNINRIWYSLYLWMFSSILCPWPLWFGDNTFNFHGIRQQNDFVSYLKSSISLSHNWPPLHRTLKSMWPSWRRTRRAPTSPASSCTSRSTGTGSASPPPTSTSSPASPRSTRSWRMLWMILGGKEIGSSQFCSSTASNKEYFKDFPLKDFIKYSST